MRIALLVVLTLMSVAQVYGSETSKKAANRKPASEGSFAYSGPSSADDVNASIQLSGPAAVAIYNAMKNAPGTDERMGYGIVCRLNADGQDGNCTINFDDITKGKIAATGDSIWCPSSQKIACDAATPVNASRFRRPVPENPEAPGMPH